jgi:deoxyribodipyrimidine photo-lyase
LNDFDLAANNGGWQWAASTGCDAQPYFRIFNPVSQSQKFDAEGRFIRRYLPELGRLPDKLIHAPWLARPVDLAAASVTIGVDYPAPIVQHDLARERTLQRFAAARTQR